MLVTAEKIIDQNIDQISLWNQIKSGFEQEFSQEICDKWLFKLELFSVCDAEITFSAPSKFLRDWIKREYLECGGKSGKGIKQVVALQNPAFKNISIIYLAKESQNISPEKPENGQLVNLSKHDNIFALGIDLNPKFTF